MDNFDDFKKDLPDYVRSEEDFMLYKMRHSAEHILTQAMQRVYGKENIIMAMGPATEEGYYFDFDSPKGFEFGEEQFEKVEAEMKKIIKENQRIERREISLKEARELFQDNKYKQEWLDEIESKDQMLTIYVNVNKNGEEVFVDLCKGPHVAYTKQVGKVKLLKMAGAYWRGDEKNKMLRRVYGTAFKTQEELDKYLVFLEEVKKRDHRKLGKELDLFLFSELVGGGLPMWTQRGTILRDEMDKFVWELRREKGYQKVTIPHITKKDLYETSGHWSKFSDELFKMDSREGHLFALKPMNCPHHTQIYSHLKRSYRDLPQRYAETTMVYRDEQSGELGGLSRVRCITQDDAHVFCRYSQIKDEFFAIWDIVDKFYSTFGFELRVRLSFHDPKEFDKYLGTPEIWKRAEASLEEIAKERGVDYFVGKGEAAMYGPKIDFMAKDSLGREHQVATIQLDMNMPERFDLTCTSEDGADERIVMLHAAIMGSIERFSSVMIEHFAGKFPLWLAPEQIRIIPISEQNNDYANEVYEKLASAGYRVEIDLDSETMQNKIRQAQEMKVPHMVVVGKREEEEKTLSMRLNTGEEKRGVKLEDYIDLLYNLVSERKLDLWK